MIFLGMVLLIMALAALTDLIIWGVRQVWRWYDRQLTPQARVFTTSATWVGPDLPSHTHTVAVQEAFDRAWEEYHGHSSSG